MEIGERKLKILAMIVELYIRAGEPVGSKAIVDHLDFSVSSATIRNEMAELVELGLLEQPHTSAGRIPSQRGYRLYVNKLMNRRSLSDDEKEFINQMLLSSADDPFRLLEEASQTLAALTHFAAVSTSPAEDNATVRRIEFVQTGRRTAMVVLMTSTGMIKNKLFRCDYDLTPEILKIFFGVLNERFRGVSVAKITPALIQTTAASLGEMTLLLPSVLTAILEAANEARCADVRLDGQTNLLFLPGFGLEHARRVMEFLKKRSDLAKLLLSHQSASTSVLIGTESKRPELSDSSVIITRYTLPENRFGAIAIIGPTRMDYAKAIASLEYLASSVEKLLGELLDTE